MVAHFKRGDDNFRRVLAHEDIDNLSIFRELYSVRSVNAGADGVEKVSFIPAMLPRSEENDFLPLVSRIKAPLNSLSINPTNS